MYRECLVLRLRYKGYSRARNGITSGNCGFRCVIYKPVKSEKRGKNLTIARWNSVFLQRELAIYKNLEIFVAQI